MKKLTKELVLEQFKKIHGDLYDYSKFEYEQEIKNFNKKDSYRPKLKFKGQFECFKKIKTPPTSISRT